MATILYEKSRLIKSEREFYGRSRNDFVRLPHVAKGHSRRGDFADSLSLVLPGPIAQRAFTRAVLANDAPAAEVEQNMIQNAADPHAAIVAAWNTGKIAHRHLAIQEISPSPATVKLSARRFGQSCSRALWTRTWMSAKSR